MVDRLVNDNKRRFVRKIKKNRYFKRSDLIGILKDGRDVIRLCWTRGCI